MDGNMKQDASTHRAIKDVEANNQSEECEDKNVHENWNFKNVSRTQIFTFISTSSLNFSSMICFSILGPFFPPEAQKKGVSTTVIGLIFGCFALSHFLSSLILGKYLVQIGPKFMFVTGMFISGCATIFFGLLDKAPDGAIFIALCFVVRSVDAIGFSASRTASFSILAEAFPKNLATALGWLEVFTGLGLILGPPIGGFLNQAYGYEIPFIVVGSIVLLMVPINFVILPKYDTIQSTGSIRTLLTIPKNLLLCLCLFSLSSCVGFLDPTLSLFLKEKFHLKVSAIGLVFLGTALTYSISTPILGILSDRFPKLRSYFIIAGNLLIALCFFMFGPVPFLHIDSKLWLFVLMLIINGFSNGLAAIPVFPEMVRGAYENGYEEGLSTLGLISGLFSAMWSIGYFVGPTLGGFLNEKFNFEWASAMQGLLPLITGILLAAYSIWEARKKKSSPSEQEVSSKLEDSKSLFKE